MDIASRRAIEDFIKKYQIRLLKRLGQNFLIDEEVIKKVAGAANLESQDVVLEVGPGLGALTQEVAKKAKKVIAVEKDPKMIEILSETLKEFKNVKVVQGDILKISNFQFLISNYKVVANLPFYLTAPVIRKFLEAKNPPKEMVLIVQKEVGQRICAKPPDMSISAVSVQFYAKPEIIDFISKKSFWPSPKVDSAILKISALNQRRKSAFNQRFFRIVKSGFSQPRKQLINNLSRRLNFNREKVKDWLLKNNIKPEQRAETLTVENWLSLTRAKRRVKMNESSSTTRAKRRVKMNESSSTKDN